MFYHFDQMFGIFIKSRNTILVDFISIFFKEVLKHQAIIYSKFSMTPCFIYIIISMTTAIGMIFFPLMYCKTLSFKRGCSDIHLQLTMHNFFGSIYIIFLYIVLILLNRYTNIIKIVRWRTILGVIFIIFLPFLIKHTNNLTSIFIIKLLSWTLITLDPRSLIWPIKVREFPILKEHL